MPKSTPQKKRKAKKRPKPPDNKEKTSPPGTLTIERKLISEIKLAEYNPRKALRPTDPEYQRLKRSIQEFGLVDPLIWNRRTGNLVGGHQRLKVLVEDLGVSQVDVSVVDLDQQSEKALNVALNNPAVGGEWDDARLAGLLAELQAGETDATLTGFDAGEIDALVAAGELQPGGEPPAKPQANTIKMAVCPKCGERFDL